MSEKDLSDEDAKYPCSYNFKHIISFCQRMMLQSKVNMLSGRMPEKGR